MAGHATMPSRTLNVKGARPGGRRLNPVLENAMPTPRLREQFHLKNEFTSFKLDPRRDLHARLLFGDRDRDLRQKLLLLMRECSYGERGFHAIIWGPAGRGK